MFDRKIWRSRIDDRIGGFARNPWRDVQLVGGNNLLTYLVIRTLEPLFEEFEREPIAAVQALADITQGPGANDIIRSAKRMRFQTARMVERDLRARATLRDAAEQLLISLETITLMRQRLNSDRATWFRNRLLHELTSYSPLEFSRLRQMLDDPCWKPLHDIIRDLRQHHGQYTPADMILLREGLNDLTPRVRSEAARGIGEFVGIPSPQLIAKLLDVALYDCDAGPRNAAACAFGKLRDRITSPELLDQLALKLADKDKFVRSSTARVVEELGEVAAKQSIIDGLVAILRDDDDTYARESAACALAQMGNAAANADVINILTQASQTAEAVSVHDATLNALIKLRKQRSPRTSVPPTRVSAPSRPRHDPAPEIPNFMDGEDAPVLPSADESTEPSSDIPSFLRVPRYVRPGTDTLRRGTEPLHA